MVYFQMTTKCVWLFMLLVLAACGVKQPVENELNLVRDGKIFVNSSPPGATIFLDNVNTHKQTPDTLIGISIGRHVIKVFLDGFISPLDSIEVLVQTDSVISTFFTLEPIVSESEIIIQTLPAGAEIFLDQQASGTFTPDTLTVTAGSHRIEVRKNGYRNKSWQVEAEAGGSLELSTSLEVNRRVLIESFANVSCIPCVAATENLLKFDAEEPDSNYTIIEYFAFWPSPNDPFYKVAPEDVDARVNYYQVATLPTLKFSGQIDADPADYSDILNRFSSAMGLVENTVGVSIRKNLQDNMLHIEVELFDFSDEFDNGNYRLFVAVIENEIHLNSPPGSNGLKDFEFVFRGFLSPSDGQEISSALSPQFFEYAFDWPNSWNYQNSHIVAFIQNSNTKQVIQATKN